MGHTGLWKSLGQPWVPSPIHNSQSALCHTAQGTEPSVQTAPLWESRLSLHPSWMAQLHTLCLDSGCPGRRGRDEEVRPTQPARLVLHSDRYGSYEGSRCGPHTSAGHNDQELVTSSDLQVPSCPNRETSGISLDPGQEKSRGLHG